MKDFILLQTCFGGGTGRRAGFKIQFWQQSVGSIPTRSTNVLLKINKIYCFANVADMYCEIIKTLSILIIHINRANYLYTFAL